MNIVYISEMAINGSGYSHITTNLCSRLAEMGHRVTVLAFTYQNEPHDFPMSILPVTNVEDTVACVHNLVLNGLADAIVVAMDIPWQEKFIGRLKRYEKPIIGIMPLESGPLCPDWAASLMNLDKVFFISQFATDEAEKVGIDAEHLRLGVDTLSWRLPTSEEHQATRRALLGIEDDKTFVILSIADNQERKNLPAAFEMVSKMKNIAEDVRYVLVTRVNSNAGWRLNTLAAKHGILDKFVPFDKNGHDILDFKKIWMLYAAADCYLNTSKAEGFGFPIVEAMACGVPVVATEVGANVEHLVQGGGWLIPPEYSYEDVYGNSNRSFIDVDAGVSALTAVYSGLDVEGAVKAARSYVEGRDWDAPAKQLDEAIKEVTHVTEA